MTRQSFSLTRRDVLRGIFLTGTAAATPAWLSACGGGTPGSGNNTAGNAAGPTPELAIPTGPLANISQNLVSTGIDNISIPDGGFRLRNVARQGAPPAVGSAYLWHTFPDGGATYARDGGGWIYVSNSEVPGNGGVGALVFDAPTSEDASGDPAIVDAYSILSGTSTNCAGGKTPWQTWLSCEEFDLSSDGDPSGMAGQTHETNPFGTDADAQAKPALGLFSHEAAVVDLAMRRVYETEDQGDGRFYRFTDQSSGSTADRLAMDQGVLEVMNIEGFEDGGYPDVGDVRRLRRVTWKPVIDPGMPQAGVRANMENPPGTRFDGGEGLWFYELPTPLPAPPGGTVPTRALIFFSTKGDNRIWAYDIDNELIEIIFDNEQIEPDYNDVDNVTVSPWGDIVVAEDLVESGRSVGIRIMVVVPNVGSRVLVEVDQPGSEITGPAFSPDGSRLYFSSQRGPSGAGIGPGSLPTPNDSNDSGQGQGGGATYELYIPPEFRGSTT